MSMARIREQISLDCPIAEALPRLEEYFTAHRDARGVTRTRLRVPVDAPLRGLAVEHEAIIVSRRTRDENNLNDVIAVTWEPAEGGPYPRFSGTLIAWAEHDPKRTFLEIDGTYSPPGGLAGELFDEAIGKRIAARTARALLEDIAQAMTRVSS